MYPSEATDTPIIIEIDNGRFNIEQDKVVFLKENCKVRFVGLSKLNATLIPFLITDKKVRLDSHKDITLAITKQICLDKEELSNKYTLIPGHLRENGYWVA